MVNAEGQTRRGAGANADRRRVGTAATLLAAARSIVAEQGAGEEAVVQLLGEHALEYYGEGLRQYMALRVGEEAAGARLEELATRFRALSPDDALAPPGVRARLYRLARELTANGGERPGTLRWRAPKRTVQSLSGIEKIRQGALGDETELLELHFARGLSAAELAFVLGADEAEVSGRLERATSRARQVLDAGEVDPSLPTALLEAFALQAEEREEQRAPVDESVLPAGTLLGARYRLGAHIGAGAFADVYRAHDVEVEGHVVAVKLLRRPSRSETARERALRELHLIASVFHPSIVHFNDNGWYEERLWFAMPWYEGESLEARMAREPLTRHEAKAIFVPLARALAAMHAAGVRHQDVKPDNIFLARLEGTGSSGEGDVLPVLLDLGVAAKDAELLLAGTPTYFAPEVAAQFAHLETSSSIGAKADVFSLALSLRNALEPTTADDVVAGSLDRFIELRAVEAPEPPVDKDLRFLRPHLARWLSPDPAERPDASQLADELDILTAPEERRERRARALRIVLPLLIAITSIFLVVGWKLRERAREEELIATKAREEATSARANLEQESSRRQELEGAIERARQRVRSGRLSTEDLTQQLVKTEGELEVAEHRVDSLSRRTRALNTQLQASRVQVEELGQSLSRAQAEGSRARSEANTLRGQLGRAQSEAQARSAQLQRSQRALSDAQAETGQLRGQLAARTSELGRARAEARSAAEARDRLTAQLDSERRRNAELARQLAQARAAARSRASASTPPGVNVQPSAPPTMSAGMRPTVRVHVGN